MGTMPSCTASFPGRTGRLVVYEWNAWEGYLVSRVFPDALRLSARVDDTTVGVLESLHQDATAFLFHLNCSRTARFPQERDALVRALAARSVTVLNSAATDITKRHIQTGCMRLGLNTVQAERDADPETKLIVKTNLNSGGYGERRLSEAERAILGTPPRFDPVDGATEYRVLRRRDVPSPWWDHPALAIERYVENQANRFHRVHLAGDRLVLSTGVAEGLFRRFGTERQRYNYFLTRGALADTSALDPSVCRILQQVLPFLRGFQLDYGAIDLVEDDAGTPYITDVNTTPGWGEPRQPGMFEHLRGLDSH